MKHTRLFAGAAVVLAAAAPLAANAQYGSMSGHVHRGQPATISGRVASVQGSSFTLDNGTTVFLNHTAINPTGETIQSGERVTVSGYGSGHGALNAQTISIHNGWHRMHGNHYGM